MRGLTRCFAYAVNMRAGDANGCTANERIINDTIVEKSYSFVPFIIQSSFVQFFSDSSISHKTNRLLANWLALTDYVCGAPPTDRV